MKFLLLIYTKVRVNFLINIFLTQTFMRKIPTGAEASNILIGEQKDLGKPILAFVRLKHAITFGG